MRVSQSELLRFDLQVAQSSKNGVTFLLQMLLIGYQIKGKSILVIGGGREGFRRIKLLILEPCNITLVAPEVCTEIIGFLPKLTFIQRKFEQEDLDNDYSLVLSCLDDPAESRKIALVCNARKIPVNCADIPEICDFYFFSQYREGLLQIGVSTNGAAPRMGALIRDNLVKSLDKRTSRILDISQSLRESIRNSTADQADTPDSISKRGKWIIQLCNDWNYDDLIELDDKGLGHWIVDLYASGLPVPLPPSRGGSLPPSFVGKISAAHIQSNCLQTTRSFIQNAIKGVLYFFGLVIAVLFTALNRFFSRIIYSRNLIMNRLPTFAALDLSFTKDPTLPPAIGQIYIVGAGPGDPELLVRKAYSILQTADLVLCDQLVPKSIQVIVPTAKLVMCMKKSAGKSDISQQVTYEKCLSALKKGMVVARLKSGDPMVYGRAGEEVLYFREMGFDPVVVPGLSTALVGPLLAGIPLTHRGVSDSITIMTGRGTEGAMPRIPEYDNKRTIVLLMSAMRTRLICDAMIEKDYPASTPAAIIQRAGWPDQRVKFGDLGDITAENVESPSLMVIGQVVKVLQRKQFDEQLVARIYFAAKKQKYIAEE